jgi:hypothetical protein
VQHVFITYGPGDEAAAIITDSYLRVAGLDTWRPPGGEQHGAPIRHWESLRTAAALVVMWSLHAAESARVECDWQYALARRLPLFIITLDSTPLPGPLAAAHRVGAIPGSRTLADLVAALETALAQRNAEPGFLTDLDGAFVDFICWFFEGVDWRYQHTDTLFPLRVSGIPNLPPEYYRVKILTTVDGAERERYALLTNRQPVLLLALDADAHANMHFFLATVWLYDGLRWQRYEWVKCDHCSRWQLAYQYRGAPAIYRTWCPLCAAGLTS